MGGNPAYPGSHDGDHDHGGWGDRGEHHRLVGIGEVRHVDDDRWREGRWTHEWRGDRFGWWWVVGPNWYLYDGPVYPYPVVEQTLGVDVMYDEAAYGTAYPPPPISQAPSAEWYYCSNPHGYYPQVPSCNVDWQAVPATPPVGSAPTYWYYCEQPQGYYPYVDRCNVPWTRVTPTAERSASAPASRNAPPPTNQPDRFWYYCQHPQGYYPTVAECDSDWIPVPSHGP